MSLKHLPLYISCLSLSLSSEIKHLLLKHIQNQHNNHIVDSNITNTKYFKSQISLIYLPHIKIQVLYHVQILFPAAEVFSITACSPVQISLVAVVSLALVLVQSQIQFC